MTHDGVKTGYANEALSRLAETLSIPVIASGGAGSKNISGMHSRLEKRMPLLLPVFFTLER